MRKPIIVVNFKTYANCQGAGAVRLARTCHSISQRTGVPIWVAVEAFDLGRVSAVIRTPVLAQNLDDAGLGQYTGALVAEDLKAAGGDGSLLNHSERPIPLRTIRHLVKRLRALKLISIVCAPTPAMARKIVACGPDYVAVEPPELIGGDVSVSTAKPSVIERSVALVKGTRVKLLVGAGVKTAEDVRIAHKLGAHGILLASGVTKAKRPSVVLRHLAEAWDVK